MKIIEETVEQEKGFKSAKTELNTEKTQMTALRELGQLVSTDSSKEHEVKRRIGFGWQSFGGTSSIFKSKLSNCLKRRVYNQCIMPTINYGSET